MIISPPAETQSARISSVTPQPEFRPAIVPSSINEKPPRSGKSKPKEKQPFTSARTLRKKTARTPAEKPDFYVEVSDSDLLGLIENNRVKVERSGSRRQNKDGTIRDYRGKYVALRERSKSRRVLAFGSAEKMNEYLANRLNVHYCQNCFTVSIDSCRNCQA